VCLQRPDPTEYEQRAQSVALGRYTSQSAIGRQSTRSRCAGVLLVAWSNLSYAYWLLIGRKRLKLGHNRATRPKCLGKARLAD
jgi:hypothetical protein